MWKQIQNNKRNSILVLLSMMLFLVIFGAVFGLVIFGYFNGDDFDIFNKKAITYMQLGLIITFIMFLRQFIALFFTGGSNILSDFNAYKVINNSHPVLENIVEEMSIASGLARKPDIYIIDSNIPNAFATGFIKRYSSIAVTTALLSELNRDELQGVIAHEIAHIINKDTMYMLFSGIILFTISSVASSICSCSCRSSSSKNNSNVLSILVAYLFSLITPVIAMLFYYTLSREREYLADACAAQFTRYPQGLSSALYKISNYSCSTESNFNSSPLVSAMCIVNPQKKKSSFDFIDNIYNSLNEMFATHPPIEKRIEVLMKMASADYRAYNEAYKSVFKTKTGLLGSDTLSKVKKISIRNIQQAVPASQLVSSETTAGDNTKNTEATQIKELNENYDNNKSFRRRKAYDAIRQHSRKIYYKCSCGTRFTFSNNYSGKEYKCPHCKVRFKVVNNVSMSNSLKM